MPIEMPIVSMHGTSDPKNEKMWSILNDLFLLGVDNLGKEAFQGSSPNSKGRSFEGCTNCLLRCISTWAEGKRSFLGFVRTQNLICVSIFFAVFEDGSS